MKAKKEVSDRSLHLLKIFVSGSFSSGWDVELLYFLRKNENESWSAVQLVEHFQIEQSQVVRSLRILCENGLIAENGIEQNYRFAPETSEQSALVELLVKMFESKKKLQVIRMIYE